MKKRLIASVTCLCLLLVMLMSSTLAWFTDSKMSHNTMTVGNVEIKQLEQYRENGVLNPWHTEDYTHNPPMNPVVPEGLASDLAKSLFNINGTDYNLFNEGQLVLDKIVSVQNVGSDPAWVRTVFAFELMRTDDGWVNPLGSKVFINENPAQKIDFPKVDENYIVVYRYVVEVEGEKNFIYSDKEISTTNLDAAFVVGVTTYSDVLNSTYTTDPSLLQVYLDQNEDGSTFRTSVNGEYEILVLSQAVQYAGFEKYGASASLNHAFGDVTAIKAAEWFGTGIPLANVTHLQGRDIPATKGIGGEDFLLTVPFVAQFEPTESLEAAQISPYRYWHADFVVTADNDVPSDSVALSGYYRAWCDALNDQKWVALVNEQMPVKAGEEVRLVHGMAQGQITVSYEGICEYGNDGIGFQCSAADVTGENTGTTITVELRLYEVPEKGKCAKGGGCTHPTAECEVGEDNYIVVGTYAYTFGAGVSSLGQMNEALTAGESIYLTKDITTETIALNGNALNGREHKLVFENEATDTSNFGIETTGGVISNVTITGDAYEYNGKNYGFRAVYASNANEDIILNNVNIDATYCININDSDFAHGLYVTGSTLNGWTSYGSAKEAVFTDCTFGKGTTGYANLRPYATTTLTGCEFAEVFTITRNSGVTGNAFTITLTNCTVNGVDVTADNFAQLLCGDATDAYALQTATWITVIVNGETVVF